MCITSFTAHSRPDSSPVVLVQSVTRSWLAGFSCYLLTVVLSKCTHNHEVAAMHLP